MLGFVPTFAGRWFEEHHVEAMTKMSIAAQRALNWNVLKLQDPSDEDFVWASLDASTTAASRGGAVFALTYPEPREMRLSLSSRSVFDNLPGWQETMYLERPERLAAFRDPNRREELRQSVEGQTLRGLLGELTNWASLSIGETFSEENKDIVGRRVGDVAKERGVDPFTAFLDIAVADELRTYFILPRIGVDERTWDLRKRVWRDPRVILGASDAGAHLDMLCNARYSTSLLGEAVREHQVIPLTEAVHYLTDVPARFYGIKDRGCLAEGYWGDLVIFDPDRIKSGPINTRHDLPGGASRLYSEPVGIESVIVNGAEVIKNNVFTGALPGRVFRSGVDTETVSLDQHLHRIGAETGRSPGH
jgi:N-acyl-D-aspartate/D-glutamate deacylase